MRCHTTSMNLSDMVYTDTFYFNGMKYLVFNSTIGKYVGYSEVGLKVADSWNSNKAVLNREQNAIDGYCKASAAFYKGFGMHMRSEPIVKLSLVKSFIGSHPAILVCSAYNFYPKMIRVTWYRDGHQVTSDVSATEELVDGDWFYQIHSHLEFTPKDEEKISCVVEHISFKEPREFVWDSSMPEAERNKVAIGATGLVLGLVACAAGLLYYRKKTQGWILLPPT